MATTSLSTDWDLNFRDDTHNLFYELCESKHAFATLSDDPRANEADNPTVPCSVTCDLLSWTSKHPLEWSQDEVLDWLFYVASQEIYQIDFKYYHAEAFRNLTGADLVCMCLTEFTAAMPKYGELLYRLFHDLVAQSCLSEPANTTSNESGSTGVDTAVLDCHLNLTQDQEELSFANTTYLENLWSVASDAEVSPAEDCSYSGGFASRSDDSSFCINRNIMPEAVPRHSQRRDNVVFPKSHTINCGDDLTASPKSLSSPDDSYLPMSPMLLTEECDLPLAPALSPKSLSSSDCSDVAILPTSLIEECSLSQDSTKVNATKRSTRNKRLWEFVRDLLKDPCCNPKLIKWEDVNEGVFRFVKSDVVAKMWGQNKNNRTMTYEKLSRAMRYYYKRGIVERVDGKRLVYRFGANAHGWS